MSAGNTPVVEVTRVSKSFPVDYSLASQLTRFWRHKQRRTVLHDIDLTIRRGEIFGLLGPNGAGKTTLLKMLATLLLPDAGTIRITGIDAVARPLAVKRRIGFSIADERSFYYRLSARENLEFFGTLAGIESNALKRRTTEVADVVGLGYALDRPLKAFSSGMRQRLAIARALLADPDLLIFDEPTRAIDPIHALELRTMIRETLVGSLGKTVLLSTNILEEAWSTCDRVAIISAGRIAAEGSPADLAARFAERRRFAVTFDRLDEGLAARVRALDGVADVEVRRDGSGDVMLISIELRGRAFTELLATLSSNGSIVRAMREVDDALFDVFRATTADNVDA
jgi:ABC-2 type transport system ATP-binding protein